MKPGYYLYGYGENQSVLWVSEDQPPLLWRWDNPGWTEVGEVGTLYDRWFNGDVDGPLDGVPAGVEPVPN